MRSFFKVFVFLVILGLSISRISATEKPVELRLAHMFPVTAGTHKVIENWAQRVQTQSKEMLKIKIFPSNTLLSGPELFEGIVKGAADIGYAFRYKPEGFEFGEALTFLLSASDPITASHIYDEIWKRFEKPMAEEWKNVKILWLAPSHYHAIATVKLVRVPEDMKGLQIRVPDKRKADLIKDLGAVPVFMSTADFISAIEKKIVDGATIHPVVIEEYKIGGKIKYVLEVSLGCPGPVFCVMNKKSYDALSPELKKIIEENNDFGKKATIEHWIRSFEEAKEYFKKTGVQMVKPNPDEMAKWSAIIEKAREKTARELDQKGYPGTEVLKFIRERLEFYSKK